MARDIDSLQELGNDTPNHFLQLEAAYPLGVPVHIISVYQLHQIISHVIRANKKAIIANVNVHALNIAYKTKWFYQFLWNSDIVFCDGFGVMLAVQILGGHIPQRITYADWTWELAEYVSLNDFSFYFLGARPGVTDKAVEKLRQKYPNLRILGTQHGYFDKNPDSSENEAVIQDINNKKPNILILGFGMPIQEEWLLNNWDKINANIALTGGAVFDYLSGDLKRAPDWMINHGLEWLGRMLIEPQRLWQRYIFGIPPFIIRIILQKAGVIHFQTPDQSP